MITEAAKLQPYLDFICDKDITTQAARKYVHMGKQELNKRPMDTTNNAINFLNKLMEQDIRQANIQDRFLVITWARKVVNKHRHLEIVEAKVNCMHNQVKEFIIRFSPLFKRGIPFLQEENRPMLSQKEYHDKCWGKY